VRACLAGAHSAHVSLERSPRTEATTFGEKQALCRERMPCGCSTTAREQTTNSIQAQAEPSSNANVDEFLRSRLNRKALNLQSQIAELESRLLKVRRSRARNEAVQNSSSSTVDGTDQGIESQTGLCLTLPTLRERRMQSAKESTALAELAVDLSAEKQPMNEQLGTNFYSPSCHDWKGESIMVSEDWTPYSSPRRPNHSGCNNTGKWPRPTPT
jgi:hypothetical protein